MRVVILILILLLVPAIPHSQALSNEALEKFILSLLEENEKLRNFVLSEEL